MFRSTTRTRAATQAMCAENCECVKCRDKLIVATMQRLVELNEESTKEFLQKIDLVHQKVKSLNTFVDELAQTLTNIESKFPKFDAFLDMKRCAKKFDSVLLSLEEMKSSFTEKPTLEKLICEKLEAFKEDIKFSINSNAVPSSNIKENVMNLSPTSQLPLNVNNKKKKVPSNLLNATSSSSLSPVPSDHSSPCDTLVTQKVRAGNKKKRHPPVSLEDLNAHVCSPAVNIINEKSSVINDEFGWIHVSCVPTYVTSTDLRDFVSKKFGLRSVICRSLLPMNLNANQCCFLTYKVGVRKRYTKELLNRHRWPSGTRIRLFT